MRVSADKSKFFQESVEFLGFTVSKEGIKTCPDKVKDILDFAVPKSLRALRSFLGLAGYYRRFVKDYAAITKPLTKYLRGENGNIGANQSRKIEITLDEEALNAFGKVKKILASEDVLLLYPDYKQPFDLTTDASSHAIGAVLSQNGRPITMISRTLSSTEEIYATNERELLAIVRALQKLRNYLYGVKHLNIYTDHQPLTFALSDKNPNAKMKRWRAFVEEYSPRFHYKPGKENFVADALSRQHINALNHEVDTESMATNSELSLTQAIPTVKNPINCFQTQIILEEGAKLPVSTSILFRTRVRHQISFSNLQDLLKAMKQCVNPNVVNGLLCELHTLALIKNELATSFPGVKFRHTTKQVIDVFNKEDQREILQIEHNRAHRSCRENEQQVLENYYFPDLRKMLKEIVSNCKICHEAKYQRHPPKPEIGLTPIPSYPGEILHVDIYSTDKTHFLTTIDKFSKFAIVFPIKSRAIVDIKEPIYELLNFYKNTKVLVCDNERSLNSETIKAILKNHFGVTIYTTPPAHSTTNGQVERFHSTLTEIARCQRLETCISDTTELILLATAKYNRTIHSVTNRKPIDIIHAMPDELVNEIKNRLVCTQQNDLKRHNIKRQTRQYKPGEKVFVKTNKRIGNKFTKLYTEKIVQSDLGTYVLIDGRKVHKINLKH
ncbi:unnamed protein product [Ceratitis capitata]|uniref:RNA-directed DNA polymerase n=1 Tax=Ceratitis capitata TaxID=7213 RepID=A0A811UTN7_CERCA|nr:unnamed protein product [Ceratitis capitata]